MDRTRQEREMQENEAQHDGYDVGDILHGSWGYDQTNVEFYRVLKRTAAGTVTLQKLGQLIAENNGFMSETVLPGEPLDCPPIRRRLIRYDDKVRGCHFARTYGWISAWNGSPAYQSHYA